MNALELVQLVRSTAALAGLPFTDGFDGVARHDTTPSILACINLAYADLVKESFLQCYRSFTAVVGQREQRLPGDFLRIYELKLTDPLMKRDYYLTAVQRQFLYPSGTGQSLPLRQGRPTKYAAYGSTLTFDLPPDKAYTLQAYADVAAEPLTDPTSIPTRLDSPLHMVLAHGGSYYASLAAMNQGDRRSEFDVTRFGEINSLWEQGKRDVRQVATARVVGATDQPLYHNTYRR